MSYVMPVEERLTSVKRVMIDTSPDAVDVEKASSCEGNSNGDTDGLPDRTSDRGSHSKPAHAATRIESYLQYIEKQLIKYKLEARGIQRVEPDECLTLTWKSYLQIFVLWFSINLAPVNFSLGMLAPTVYTLSFKDAAFCAVFGALLGSMACAYITTFGPISGNRTLVLFPIPSGGWWLTDAGTDYCQIHDGLVAKQIDCYLEYDSHAGVFHDRYGSCRSDTLGCIFSW